MNIDFLYPLPDLPPQGGPSVKNPARWDLAEVPDCRGGISPLGETGKGVLI